MMNRTWITRLAIVPSLALLLIGCQKEPAGSSTPGGTTSGTTQIVQPWIDTENEFPVPSVTSATGNYKGQKITLSFVATPNQKADDDQIFFHNGYATFRNADGMRDGEWINRYSCMDSSGNILYTIEKDFDALLPLNEDGSTYGITMAMDEAFKVDSKGNLTPMDIDQYMELEEAAKLQAPWNVLAATYGVLEEATDKNGNACYQLVHPDGTVAGTFPADKGEIMLLDKNLVVVGDMGDDMYLYNAEGKQISNSAFSKFGYFYNGIAPFWQEEKMGIMGEDGSIIIPAVVDVPANPLSVLRFSEDLLVVQNANYGNLCIFKITRE